jgi:hypothetical protein
LHDFSPRKEGRWEWFYLKIYKLWPGSSSPNYDEKQGGKRETEINGTYATTRKD